jgi:hypothetical protein
LPRKILTRKKYCNEYQQNKFVKMLLDILLLQTKKIGNIITILIKVSTEKQQKKIDLHLSEYQ